MAITIKPIITGVTGMVGEGVLQTVLQDTRVSKVLIINRKPSGFSHPKLKEIIHADFFDLSPIEGQLSGYNACYFCLGVSSVGMDADKYYRLTYTLTMHAGQVLSRLNPDMVFCYVSGASTDSTEQGKLRWARVKGKTENDLAKLFKNMYKFRPGGLIPYKNAKNVQKLYKWLGWLVKLIGAIYPNGVCSLKQLGEAMLQVTVAGYEQQTVEVSDIKVLAGQYENG